MIRDRAGFVYDELEEGHADSIGSARDWITDGCGHYWPARCPQCGAQMQIIRPGDCRCSAECWLKEKK